MTINWDEIRKHGYCGPADPAPGVPHLYFTYRYSDATPDFESERRARVLIDSSINSSTETVIQAARCLIAEGELQWDKVVFVHRPSEMYLMTNEYGSSNGWPMELFATANELAERTLRAALAKVLARREEMKREQANRLHLG